MLMSSSPLSMLISLYDESVGFSIVETWPVCFPWHQIFDVSLSEQPVYGLIFVALRHQFQTKNEWNVSRVQGSR